VFTFVILNNAVFLRKRHGVDWY